MISKGFLKSSFIYTVIGALPLASGIILLPFYTNYLSTSLFGLLALYISFTFFIQILVNFGFDVYVAVHYFEYKDNPAKLRECIGTAVSLLLMIAGITSILFLLLGDFTFKIIFKDTGLSFFPYGFMSVLTAIFNSFFKMYCSLLINQQRSMNFFWMNLFNFVLTITISLFGLYLYPESLIGPMWGRLLSGLGIFILAFILLIKEFGIHFERSYLKGIWQYNYPLVLYFFLGWVLTYIDRFIINNYMHPADVGIYDFAVKCTLLIEFLQMGLSNSMNPKIFSIWKDKNINTSTPEVNRYYNSFTAITVLMIPATILLIPLIVPIIVTKVQYYDAFIYLPILALGFIFRGLYNMYFTPFYYFKKTIMLTKVLLFSSVVQIIISILFIKTWGLWGIVWAGFISKLMQVVFLWIESRKIFNYKFNLTKLIYLPILFSAFIILSEYLLSKSTNTILIHALEFFVGSILIFFLYRKELFLVLRTYLLD